MSTFKNPLIVIHAELICQGIEIFRKYVPKGLTFGEAFILFSVNAYYTSFYIESVMKRQVALYIVGNNSHNIWMFTPVSNMIGYCLLHSILCLIHLMEILNHTFIVGMPELNICPGIFHR